MSLVTYGLGASGGGTSFVMRAYHTVSPVGYVYWTVPTEPDGSAAFGPYPSGELTEVVVLREFVAVP